MAAGATESKMANALAIPTNRELQSEFRTADWRSPILLADVELGPICRQFTPGMARDGGPPDCFRRYFGHDGHFFRHSP